MTTRTLVIGYGNSLRGDDAAGLHAAAAIEQWNDPDITVRTFHQLVPEIAALFDGFHRVIFLDASREGASVQVVRLQPTDGDVNQTHFFTPSALLRLSQVLSGHELDAWLVTVPGINFEVTESLSPRTQKLIGDAVERVRRLVGSAPVA